MLRVIIRNCLIVAALANVPPLHYYFRSGAQKSTVRYLYKKRNIIRVNYAGKHIQ